jgi:hypothetical protein
MNDDNDRLHSLDNFDNLIDRALDSYTPREPRPGLSERVLSSRSSMAAVNRLQLRTDRPIWALAASVALLAVAVIPLWFKSPRPALVVVQRPAPAAAEPYLRAEAASAVPANPAPDSRFAVQAASDSEPKAQPAGMPDTDESLAFAPIVIKPITLAPIGIAAGN